MKLKIFCTAQETIKKMKRKLSEWEKIFANDATDIGPISKMYKQLMQLNIKQRQPKPKTDGITKETFLQRRYTDCQETHERMLNIIRQMQIKTTVRDHLTPVRMAIIKESTNNKCWRGCGEKGTLLHCRWECKLIQPLWRTVWKFLKKQK